MLDSLLLSNWDTHKPYVSSAIAPVSLLKKIGINNVVCQMAKEHCGVDDPHIYVEISKETFDGDTEYSIGILALETEIPEEDLKDIQQSGLGFYVSIRGLMEEYTNVYLFMSSEQEEVLESYFLSLTEG